MPANPKRPAVTERELQELFGTQLMARAERELSAGHPAVRELYRNNIVSTQWPAEPEQPRQILFSDRGEVGYDCPCDIWQRGDDCVHVASAALAWVRQPDSFVPQPTAFDLDAYYENADAVNLELGAEFGDLFGDDLGEDADDELDETPTASIDITIAQSGPGRLTIGWTAPDLTAAYREVLQSLTLPQMRELAERRGLRLPGNKREPALDLLAEALARPEALEALWPSLSTEARLVLAVLPFLNTYMGVMTSQLRTVLNGLVPKLGQRLDAALTELREAGLVTANNYGSLTWPAGLELRLPPEPALLAPRANAAGLRVVTAPPPTAFSALTSRLLLALHGGASALSVRPAHQPHPLENKLFGAGQQWPYVLAELEALAQQQNQERALRQYSLSVPPAPPLLDDASTEALARQMEVEPAVLDFALACLRAQDHLALPAGAAPVVNPQTLVGYISQQPLPMALPLFTAYLYDKSWTEFDLARARYPDLVLGHPARPMFNFGYNELLQLLSVARLMLIQLLRRAAAGEWFDLGLVVARAHTLNALNAFWPAPGALVLFKAGQHLNPANQDDWRQFYGPFLEAVLAGPLHWQGLVDLGYQGDRLAAFRLTELGGFVLLQSKTLSGPAVAQTGPALTFPRRGVLRLQPVGVKPDLLGLLGRLGPLAIGPDGTLDYRLTGQGFGQALQAGWSSDRILEALAEAAGGPPPAELAQRLREWEAHTGEVQLYRRLALVELADDYALNELLAGTSLARYLLYRFSPRLIAIRPEGLAALREELVSKGYTPKVEGPA